MALRNTNLLIQASPIPPTFRGKPQEFADELVRRMKIVSPSGTNFIYIGDIEPTSNVGPWLKGGDRWYVFDEDVKRYVPLNIDDSATTWYAIGASTPITTTPPLWLRTTQDASQANPSYGTPLGWYVFDGLNWVSFVGLVPFGTTANRPASPLAFQQYYDSTISCLIWYERNAWRTVSGVVGDIKAVAWETQAEALQYNPGWEVLGLTNQNVRGRTISQATQNADGSSALTVGTGVTTRGQGEVFGEDKDLKTPAGATQSPKLTLPPTIALWHLVKV